MQVLNTKKLIENIERKGIYIDAKDKRKFKRYNYYQVINAYKNIFVDKIEDIDDRYKKSFNLPDGISSENMFIKICQYICKKYGRQPESNEIESYVKEIKKIDYYHHIYSNRVRYSDFIRMYKFEHELRMVLLKYVLIIEESLKNIFVSSLNDSKVSDVFLIDIGNYVSDSKKINDTIDSIKLVLEKQKNKHSKPMERKKYQKIYIPYWIIINELTLKETLKVINNLSDSYYNKIYLACLECFTNMKLGINIDDKDKKTYISKMRNILEIIANFRNLLAHNQPLYLFNVKDSKTSFKSINYEYPKVKDQKSMNSDTMSIFAKFFGSDRYNSRTQNVKIDLSWIIYAIYKIIITMDSNSTIYTEIINIFNKYSIIDIKDEKIIDDFDSLEKLLESIDEFLKYEYNTEQIIKDIEKTSRFKKSIKHEGIIIENLKKDIKKYRKKVCIKKVSPKYNIFQFSNKYFEYTGIDKNYFNKLK